MNEVRVLVVQVKVHGWSESNNSVAVAGYLGHLFFLERLGTSEANVLSGEVLSQSDSCRHSYLHLVLSVLAISGIQEGSSFQRSLVTGHILDMQISVARRRDQVS